MRLIDPEIQIKIDKLKEEKEIYLQKYIHYSDLNDIVALNGIEVILNDIVARINSLEAVKYM